MKNFILAGVLGASFCSMTILADDLTGYVSDAHCGAAHSKVSEANTKCVNKCMGGGSDPVLVKDGKVMTFDDESKAKAKGFAGQDVKIDGTMNGDVVTINSIGKAE